MNQRISVLSIAITLWLAGLAGCTWQDTLSQLQQVPAKAKLQSQIVVKNGPLWKLPPHAHVEVIVPDHEVQSALATTADTAVSSVFPERGGRPDYQLHVVWPEQLDRGFFAKRRDLDVHIVDARGVTVDHLVLVIDPTLWGRDWHQHQMIYASFRSLADALSAG